MHKANLMLQLSIFDAVHPRLNDPPELVDTDALKLPARMILHGRPQTEMKGQGRIGKTSYMNVHKANFGSQLSIFYTGTPSPE